MIELYGPQHLPHLRRAGRIARATLEEIGRRLAPGISTAQIDRWVRADTEARGAGCSQLGYHGFPAAVCTSRNHVVCHGIPSEREILEPGDIINVDVTSNACGFHGDTSATFFIGDPSPEARHVVEVARRCLEAGIREVRPGARLGDIGAAIDALAKSEECSVVREFGGHGIGRSMHEPPHVPHHGRRGSGLRLSRGMVFTDDQPRLSGGGGALGRMDTVVTRDGSLSAQFEHTIFVTDGGCEVLTQT